ncbi:AraC family transcriptional regulator [bacterium]|nr:AraC family transcriptional regulator [bacterium]
MTISDQADIRRYSDLNSLECMRARFVQHTFPRHSHDTYVIEWVESGIDRFFCKDAIYQAPAGSFVLINPLEVHTGSASGSSALQYRSMYPSVDMMTDIQKNFQSHSQEIPLFSKTVIRDAALEKTFKKFWSSLDEDGTPVRRQTLLMMFLLQLLRRYSATACDPKPIGKEKNSIQKIKDYIADNYTETISLDELATLSGLSPFYLLRAFRKETGLPPYEFLINIRIERAKRLLIRRTPIAVVAHSTGFADQSHFTRFFKRLTGVTPGQYLS